MLINLSNPLGFSQNILPSPWPTAKKTAEKKLAHHRPLRNRWNALVTPPTAKKPQNKIYHTTDRLETAKKIYHTTDRFETF